MSSPAVNATTSVDVVKMANAGIQDIAALLPLLGTEHCEALIASALQNGLLYAAATPVSIFGSLGIARAGFAVLWNSIDSDWEWLPGPAFMRNAGFKPPGLAGLLSHVEGRNARLCFAEERLRKLLARKRIRTVKVDLCSRQLFLWNLRLLGLTTVLGFCGILPYVYIIMVFLPSVPVRSTWLYPILRILGCNIIAVTAQVILQIRILQETYYRIRFVATEGYLKEHNQPLPAFWNATQCSRAVLRLFQTSLLQRPPSQSGKHDSTTTLSDEEQTRLLSGIDTLSSFDFTTPCNGHKRGTAPTQDRQPTDIEWQESSPRTSVGSSHHVLRPFSRLQHTVWLSWIPNDVVSFTLLASWFFLLCGIISTLVGYVGCFTIIKSVPQPTSKGPIVWLVCETVLVVGRTFAWGYNPEWDDAGSPVVLKKVSLGKSLPPSHERPSYGIGWKLDGLTPYDMHAVLVAVDDNDNRATSPETNAKAAENVKTYLEDVLLVPASQIVTLSDEEATKERILEELRVLSEKTSVKDGAPVLVYFATQIKWVGGRVVIVPYIKPSNGLQGLGDAGRTGSPSVDPGHLPYQTVTDILNRLAREKTDNITVVLDTSDASSVPKQGKAEVGTHSLDLQYAVGGASGPSLSAGQTELIPIPSSVDLPSHVLIAHATQPDPEKSNNSTPKPEESFSHRFVKTLSSADKKTTYAIFVDKLNQGQLEWQPAISRGIHENRLLFNGLFSCEIADDKATPVITVEYSDETW